MKVDEWTRVWTETYHCLIREVERGVEPAIDSYAAEDRGECFAVFSEYFFESPALVLTEYPAVYEQLARFYRQDPDARRR
jgi:MtfA peptidase